MGKWEILFEFSTITSLFGFLQAFFQEVKLLIFFPSPQTVFWDALVLFRGPWESKRVFREVSVSLQICRRTIFI